MDATERGSRLGQLVNAATATIGGGSHRPAVPGRLDSPAAEPALDDLLAGAGDLAPPRAPGRPWTLTKGNSHCRLYDLAELGEDDRRRVEAEASVGLALGELPGIVPTRAVERRGDWLVIARARLPETLADHLAAGAIARLPPEAYADGIAAVAQILQGAHDRGLVHLDLRPERIALADPRTGQPAVADFAIGGFEAEVVPDPYVAQECFLGERGPSVDQYALGVIAHEVFTARGAPATTEPVRKVLARATATNPADRFAGIIEFGDALRAAVASEAPRGLADRIEALSPAKRAALTPTLITVLASLTADTAAAPGNSESAGLLLLTTSLAVGLTGAIVFAAVALATRIRGTRRLLGFRILGSRLVQLVIFLALMAVGYDGTANLNDDVLRSAVIVFGGCALLSPPRQDRGLVLFWAARLWDRRWAWPPFHRGASTAAVLVAAAVLVGAPALAKTVHDDFEFPTISAAEFGPLDAVWNLRVLLSRDEEAAACEQAMAPAADRDPVLCREIAHIAAFVQAHEPVRHFRWDFAVHGPLGAFRVQELPGPPDLRIWTLLTPDREAAGTIYTKGPNARRLVIQLSRNPPSGKDLALRQSWLYEVAWNGDEYRVTEFRACTIGPPGSGKKPADCIIASTASRADLERVLGKRGKVSGG